MITRSPLDEDAEPAADRLLRIVSGFIGAGYVFYLVLLVGDIRAGADVTATWWTPTALVLIFGTGISIGVASLRGSSKWIRRACTTAAIGFLAATGLWFTAWNGTTIDSARGMYFSQFNGLASVAAAVWRPHWTITHLTVGAVVVTWANQLVRTASHNGPPLPEMAWNFGFCLLPVAATIMALRTGRILDATRAETYATAAHAASVTARTVERTRINALTHDNIMTTLLAAARQPMSTRITGDAASAIDKLDAQRTGNDDAAFDTAHVVAHVRVATAEVDDTVTLDTTIDPGATLTRYPVEPVRTITAAIAEALRNSVRHAGPAAERSLALHISSSRITATVSDTGIGFDPAAVPVHRLGVAVSIVGRMRQLPGGTARIESRPHAGTRIHLEWDRST